MVPRGPQHDGKRPHDHGPVRNRCPPTARVPSTPRLHESTSTAARCGRGRPGRFATRPANGKGFATRPARWTGNSPERTETTEANVETGRLKGGEVL